jgi:hypothetical protein
MSHFSFGGWGLQKATAGGFQGTEDVAARNGVRPIGAVRAVAGMTATGSIQENVVSIHGEEGL